MTHSLTSFLSRKEYLVLDECYWLCLCPGNASKEQEAPAPQISIGMPQYEELDLDTLQSRRVATVGWTFKWYEAS